MSFDDAYCYTHYWEGGKLENDPDDPGGLTNCGIVLDILKAMGHQGDFDNDGDVDADDLRKMTPEQAVPVYRAQWWDRYGLALINDWDVAVKLMDTMVNLGPTEGVLCLQRGLKTGPLRQFISTSHSIVLDGRLGPNTRGAVGDLNLNQIETLLSAMCSEQAGVYRMIVKRRPASAKFLAGWLRRAYSTPGQIYGELDLN